jgi:hypothetical protein
MREEIHASSYSLAANGFEKVRFVLMFDNEALLAAERAEKYYLIWDSSTLAILKVQDNDPGGEELSARAITLFEFDTAEEREQYLQAHYSNAMKEGSFFRRAAQVFNARRGYTDWGS